MDVPPLPLEFAERPADIAALKAMLLGGSGRAAGISGVAGKVGVHGMGGLGKSVLAAALARDDEVRARFADGIVWLTFGRQPDIASQQTAFLQALTGTRQAFPTIEEGKQAVAKASAGARLLVVLDDVWDATDALVFGTLGDRCRLLVTTRDTRVLTALNAAEHRVDLLAPDAALAFLIARAGSAAAPVDEAEHSVAAAVVRECGRLPLALAAIGALVGNGRYTWAMALDALRSPNRSRLARLKAASREYQFGDALSALDVSVQALDDQTRRAFLACAVFAEDMAIPEAALRTLWSDLCPDPEDADDIAHLLVERSLWQRDQQRRYRLHDLYHDYLRAMTPDLAAAHRHLVERYRAACGGAWAGATDDGYLFQNLPAHLAGAGHHEELRALLFDARWLYARLAAAGPAGLPEDCARLESDADAAVLGGAISLSAHVLAADPLQLPGQLIGRLPSDIGRYGGALRGAMRDAARRPALLPLRPTLTQPGTGLVRIMVGHEAPIRTVAALRDGRRGLSGGDDMTIRLWDLKSGTELRCLKGHVSSVSAVAMLPDGRRAISASNDLTLRLWDLESGAELRRFIGHNARVKAVAVLPDGRCAISGSVDGTLRLWDLENGAELGQFKDGYGVTSVAGLPDGRRVISANVVHNLRLWELGGCARLSLIGEFTGKGVIAVPLSDGRRVISANGGRQFRIYDLDSIEKVGAFEVHGWDTQVSSLAVAKSRLIYASNDQAIHVWNLESGSELCCFKGHKRTVHAISVLPDGRHALSAGDDKIVRLWDLESEPSSYQPDGHDGGVNTIAILKGQCIVTGSSDKSICIRNEKGDILRSFTIHSAAVWSISILPDGRHALSTSSDGTLRLWSLESGVELRCLKAHGGFDVWAVAALPNGRHAVSAGEDRALYLWDLESGEKLHCMRRHDGGIWAVAVLPDGHRAISASKDETLRLWDLKSGTELLCIHGHMGGATGTWSKTPGNEVATPRRSATRGLVGG
jgi:WD40 repeat protein